MEDSADSERFAFFKMLRNQLFSSHQTRLEEVENISAFQDRQNMTTYTSGGQVITSYYNFRKFYYTS